MPEQRPAPVSVLAGLAQQGSTSITGRSATAHEGTRSPVVVLGPELEPHVNSRDSPLTLGDHSSLQDTTEMSPRHFAPNTISHAEKGVEAAVQQHHQFTWFTFPAEIRNMIYDLLLHWPDCRELYGGFYKELDAYYFRRKGCRHEFPSFERQLRTPTILLLCKSITEECMPMLKSRWLVIDRVPPFQAGDTGPIPISQFIGRRTLQSVVHIDIRIGLGEGNLGSGWIWVKILDQLLEILSERNSFRDLRLLIRLCNVDNYNIWREEFRIYEDIMRKKMPRFIQRNPNIWKPSEIWVDEWKIEGHEAFFENSTREMKEKPQSRQYPDPEFFPGSIMELLKDETEDVEEW